MFRNNKGIALIALYGVIVIVLVITASFGYRVINSYKLAEIRRERARAYFIARGGCEDAMNDISIREANKEVVPIPTTPWNLSTDVDGDGVNDATSTVTQLADPDSTDVVGYYQIDTRVQVPTGISSSGWVRVHQVVAAIERYPWQYAVFYDDDLEVLPGPPMVLGGKVHTNEDMYLGANNTLTIDTDYVRAVGNIYNSRKDQPVTQAGDVRIAVKDSSPATFALMWNRSSEPIPMDSRNPDWTNGSQTRWNGTVQSGVHGVTKLEPPDVSSIQPGGYYQTNADLNIVVDPTGGTTVVDASGNPVTLPPNTITESTVYNHREGKWVTLTNIDMSLLNGSGHYPANGLLYASRQDSVAGTPNGIRLINGENLAGTLSMVSNNPVYIQGDFNKVPADPEVDPPWYPSGVICDSINLLSNDWDDANSAGGLSSRQASSTEVNAAFISGVDTTALGDYNGGVENFPRFHENWSGRTLSIRGSFVELWNNEIAQGHWNSQSYSPPNRDWHYDTRFNTLTNLPPFAPYIVELQRLSWWQDV